MLPQPFYYSYEGQKGLEMGSILQVLNSMKTAHFVPQLKHKALPIDGVGWCFALLLFCLTASHIGNVLSLSAPDIDESSVMQLAEMGFPLEACRKAVYYTGNMGAEVAFNWIIAHMEEPGL